MTVRTRFAPSPTGFLHVGSARTALFAWLYARNHGGQFILRIEDTDQEREVEGAVGHIIESLAWLGIEYDEGPNKKGPYDPYFQSGRLASYIAYAHQLLAAGFAYPDPFTEEEVAAWRATAEAEKRPFLYREHRPETAGEWDGTRPLRFKVPDIKRYTWNDMVRGELTAGEEALDDFILIKSDGFPTYNFAHVIDDIEMKITHVMRGEEFISSTPKFLSLYEALDVAPPHFATLPPILGEAGTKKLSKRDGAKDVLEYREDGYMPEALMNFLALIGWNPGDDREFLTKDDLVDHFDIERVQKSGGAFNEEKLLFLNREWMRTLSDSEYLTRGGLRASDMDRLALAVPLIKERASTFSEARGMLTGELACLFETPELSKEVLTATYSAAESFIHLEKLEEIVAGLSDTGDIDSIKAACMAYADTILKEEGGRGAALWPLRYALSGAERSPDPFTLIHILGVDESVARIQNARKILTP
jgi:glutamyl-tRNA synthetase